MSLKLHDYQQHGVDQIHKMFESHNKILYQLSTGGGKTFVFSFLTKDWVKKTGQKVLILCHRNELVEQTIASMLAIGVTCEAVTASKKKLNHSSDCYVAMIETANNRLQKNPFFFKNVGLVVADECHILIFDKVFDYFKNSKILGCSATPVVNKRVKFWRCKHCRNEYKEPEACCYDETDEWSRPFSMSNLYENIVCGPKISTLIDRETLVKELSIIKQYANNENLKVGSDGEFTNDSIDEEYGSDGATFNVMLNYEQYCIGKKTMIFNGTSKVNLKLYNKFLEKGYNVRMFDSVNKKESGNRKDLIEWFRETPDAILMNVGVFTTGFDVKEVQAVILNRPTLSLSLFIQIAGRGARSTMKIYKDHFIFIDGGGNIDRFGEFSDDTRDWEVIFFEGVGKEKIRKEQAFDIVGCTNCGALMAKSEQSCPECGTVEEVSEKPKPEEILSEEVLTPIRKIPPPNGERIYQYTKAIGENINFAFKIMIGQIVDMFRYYRVSLSVYQNTLASGKLLKRVNVMIQKCYFLLLSKIDIQAENNRTINYLSNKVLEKLSNFYGRH